MIIANCSHTIIKNLFGKKISGIEDILKSLWYELIHLFHYTILW